jgi:hypothetical protein
LLRRVRFGQLRFVVIVSYGRTGSTLLQGVLMTAPNVLIRGEQGGTIALLHRWYDELCRHQSRLTRRYETSRRHPFFGIGGFPRDTALRRIRLLLEETLLRPRADTAVVGFKENRWPDDVGATLAFLRELLPGVRFVVNTRSLDAVARSGFWRDRPDAREQIRRRHDAIVEAAGRLHDDVYVVHYDDWIADLETLRGLFDWLAIEFDPLRVAEVMRQPHSYRNRSIDRLDKVSAPRSRSSPQGCDGSVACIATTWAALTAVQVTALATALAGVGPFAG